MSAINYSYLSASIGSSLAADLAGKTPKNTPIIADTPKPRNIEYNGTENDHAK